MGFSNLTLQQLKILFTLASTKNFTRTAELLNMTQPGVSAHIKKAEDILKTTLFKRDKGNLIITSSCHDILPVIEDIFTKIAIIESKSKAIAGKELTGKLRFSLTESLLLWGPVFQDYKKISLCFI